MPPKKETTRPKHKAITTGTPEARHTIWKAISNIQSKWELNAAEMARLLHTKPPTFHSWKTREEIPVSEPLSPDMEIVVAVLAIYRSLSSMFSNPKDQITWLNTQHPELQAIPLKFAEASSPGLFQLRAYLDFVRGRGA
jgi:hypothetical protein